jgi:microcystin-dependent protein
MDYYLGEIRLFAGNYVPEDFVACDGRLLTLSGNEALFTLIGTTWGGDGRTTFGVPDLRGRVPVGQGHGTGLSSRALAQTGGQEQVTLTVAQMPAHTHTLNVSLDPGASNIPTGNLLAAVTGGSVMYYDTTTTGATTNLNFSNNAIDPVGASVEHNNMQPYLALTYMICTRGLFPDRAT